MYRLACVAVLIICCPLLRAQQPYSVTRVFGLDDDVVYAYEVDGATSTFTVDSPGFVTFRGIEFDRARDRVVLLGTDLSSCWLISVDASLDPDSMQVLRSGIDAGAMGVDVDPASGRIYWWENGQILSVGPMGGGAPIVEADNVPPAEQLEIDVARGLYVTNSEFYNMLSVGQLGGVGSPMPDIIPPVLDNTASFLYRFDVAIEPVSGDVLWSEYGFGSAVFRVPYDQPLSPPEVVMGNINPTGQPGEVIPLYYGVSAIGDQVTSVTARLISAGIQEGPFLTIKDCTTGQITSTDCDAYLTTMDTDFYIAPILVQPVGGLVDLGESIELQVVASDASSTFQWSRNGVPVQDDGRVTGASTDTLLITDAMLSDTDQYACTVVASNGDTQTSDQVLVAVRGSPSSACTADLNGDGELNFFDVSAFLSAYNAGCP